ncbi:RNA-directed DNA polymerase, eukaryota, reverse transcriptase zinc-binding domain protein [Tanacetum coccineum]
MRSKRTIKPTKIFDNSISNSNKNLNKQKIETKKKETSSNNENESVEYDGDGDVGIVDKLKMKDNGVFGSMNASGEENVVEVNGEVERLENDRNNEIKENIKGEEVIEGDKNEKVNDELNKPKSYAKKVTNNLKTNDNELFSVPTCLNKDGEEVVVFDEELVKEGSEKWKNTVCGYFVGCRMNVNELKYNIRRMWGKHGLKDIVVDADGICYFKFKHEEGRNFVIDQSPWLVNGKPLLVQKWDPETDFVKESPCKIPVWIRLLNVPLEAWNVNGISAISSRLGRPIKIDQITAKMCKEGSGRLGFARVLVEINAEKPFLDSVEINYVDGEKNVKKSKWVKVEYSWKPNRCSHCSVFGHLTQNCRVKNSGPDVVNDSRNGKKAYDEDNKEGFVEVRNRKNYRDRRGMWNNNQKNSQAIRKDSANPVNVTKENVNEIRKSANKYAVLFEDNDSRLDDPCFDKRLIWQAMEKGEKEMSDEEDVFENHNQAVNSLIADDIEGNAGGEGKKLHICVVLETHLKTKGFNRICDRVFRNWKWVSNVGFSPNSCRIVVGWNNNEIDIMVVHYNSQAIFCQVELKNLKTKIYISFIYASNLISERMDLCRNLMMQKKVVNGWPWILIRDFTVTLKIDEHSSGGSTMTSEMGEFRDAVNSLEIKDICSTGFHYTWTKSLKNPSNSILKKLDRIMMNEEFLNKFADAHGIFLPYLISDHSPSMLTIPNVGNNKKRSFRFANYIADKNDFLETVKGVWDKDIKEKLKNAQSILDGYPHNMEKRIEAINMLNEYTSAAEDELKLLHQKARIQWLKEGDKNTAYFHRTLKTRKHKGRNFLGTSFPVTSLSSLGDIVSLRLSEEDAAEMVREVNNKEIKEAVFDIDSNKVVGPDGYSSCFFKKSWQIVGEDICKAIKELFINGKILGEINATLIALVPKIDTPKKVSDFRPKLVAMHIQDNILIVQELLKGYNRKSGSRRSAMKIDLQKAYDTISWDFIKDVLSVVGFHDTMISWIMSCITTTKFSIYVNCAIKGYFNGGRGLIQRDPISPYLFMLVMEVFNMIMIKNVEGTSKFKYHYGCKDLKLTHMCFADNLLVLCHGDAKSIKMSQDEIEEEKTNMLQVQPFKCGVIPMKYLGVPLLAKRLGVSDCKCLIENVENIFNCWKNRHLSYAGRIQLIASVLSAMQQYWASVYMLPDTAIKELDQLFKRFLWSAGKSTKGKTRVAWNLVCRPKEQVKWVNSVKLKGRSIREIDYAGSDSYGWKKMLDLRNKVSHHAMFQVGNGKSISAWYDKWCSLGPLSSFIPNKAIFDARMSDKDCLADIIHEGKWMWPEEWNVTFPQLRSIKIPMLRDGVDGVKWMDKNNQVCKFSTKIVWLTLRDDWPKVKWKHIVWFPQCNPKQAIILWMAIQGKLLTQDRMKQVQKGKLKCSLCNSCPDSHDHLFFNCQYARNIWHRISSKGNMLNGMQSLSYVVRLIETKPMKSTIWQGNLLEGVCSLADDAWGWSVIMLSSEDVAANLTFSHISTQKM